MELDRMNNKLVSIITPCYNGERHIGETIDSVLSQTYPNFEMIIVDDGSKDNSAKLVQKYQQKDKRIKLIKQTNAGSAAARNNGIRHANGRYIALLDADDVWLPNFLEQQIHFMKKNHTVCVFSAYDRIDEKSRPIGHTTNAKSFITTKDMKVMNQIGCLTGLYDASKYGKKYLKEELNSIRDDYAYWYDIVSLENEAYGNQEVLAKYRVMKSSTTGDKKKLIGKQYKFYRTYLNESPVVALINLFRWGIAGIRKFN